MYLREFVTPRQVPQYSKTISPGKHCPLFGVGAVFSGIQNVTLIYIGTQDCVYYAKLETLHQQQGKGGSRILAVQLTDSDVIFGIRPQLEDLLDREANRPGTKAVFLVTSCSLEVLSEDLQSVVNTVAARTGKTITLIPTENFKTFSYFQGMEQALAALTGCVRPGLKKPRHFAVLGARHPGAAQSEPVRYLLAQGYQLDSILPYDITMDKLEALSQVEFALVLDGTGLETGKKLQKLYHIPYIRFDQKLNLNATISAWKSLGTLTGDNVQPFINENLEAIRTLVDDLRPQLTGKTFFYSQVILYPFETCLFLTQLGMIPTVIFLGSVIDQDDFSRQALEALANPRMLQNASSQAVEAMLAQCPPDYFIGAVGSVLDQYSTVHVNLKTRPVEAGFAFYRNCLNQLAESLRSGRDAG